MFTDCPSCESQFRIRAAQLGAADGWVRCGNCGETFYALERLRDAPVKQVPILRQPAQVADGAPVESIGLLLQQQPGAEEPVPEDVEPEQPVEEQPIPQDVEPEQPVEEEPIPEDVRPDHLVEQEPAPEDAEPEYPVEQKPTPEDAEPEQPVEAVQLADELLTPVQEPIEAETAGAEEDREAAPELPAVLADDKEKKTASFAPAIWSSLVFVLALVAVAQLAWFNRDALVRAYPALAPRVEQLCESLQCEPIRFRDVSAIELLSRQVSQHPRYPNALLASATMVNKAEYAQPFPDIELLIFASDGQVVSRGRFKPGEYLNPDVSRFAGMPPGAPIHVGLDLDGPARDAASFRFRFH